MIHSSFGRLFESMSTQDEIASSLTFLYRLFVTLGYLTEDEINWPPHNAKPFNVSKCIELGYHSSAINLLQKIPWTTTTLPIYYKSITVDYSCDDALEANRDPRHYMIDDPDDPQYLDGWMLHLTYGQTRGVSLTLDAREGRKLRLSSRRLFSSTMLQPFCFQDHDMLRSITQLTFCSYIRKGPFVSLTTTARTTAMMDCPAQTIRATT